MSFLQQGEKGNELANTQLKSMTYTTMIFNGIYTSISASVFEKSQDSNLMNPMFLIFISAPWKIVPTSLCW